MEAYCTHEGGAGRGGRVEDGDASLSREDQPVKTVWVVVLTVLQ